MSCGNSDLQNVGRSGFDGGTSQEERDKPRVESIFGTYSARKDMTTKVFPKSVKRRIIAASIYSEEDWLLRGSFWGGGRAVSRGGGSEKSGGLTIDYKFVGG